MSEFKYWAFLSYSHTDKKWGDWLHKALETYRVPRRLIGKDSRDGKVPVRLFPIFRDREELPVSADLGANITEALRQSRYLIVICSPRAAASHWVNEEIKTFKKFGREDRILALIIDGEPNASDGKPGFSPDDECFPEALRYRCSEDGELLETRIEAIAADAREGKDGKTNAKLKLLAGLLGVNYDDLKQREQQRVRQRRFLAAIAAVAVIGLIVGSWTWQEIRRVDKKFFNPGKDSTKHGSFASDCAQCHDRSPMAGNGITLARFKTIVDDRFHREIDFKSIDRKCETCHEHHTFHEANVTHDRSCSACHQEHQGPGPMKLVASSNCASCHGNREVMEASAHKGMQLPPDAFRRHLNSPQQVVFELPRPSRGYTQTFASFWDGHPEFELNTIKARDPDVLRFNHQRHFASDVPLLNGRRLDCNYCHRADLNGRYFERISFAANCQACHSLEFDAKNPELTIPHCGSALARTFLRSLPTQYAELAFKKGRVNDVETFVAEQMTQLREQFHSGDELEKIIFFTIDPSKLQQKAPTSARAGFVGCAFCHDVKEVRNAAPAIVKPIMIDRWMARSDFNHAKHVTLKCDECHHASLSRDTADVLMPSKANCVICHSPTGKVAAECVTCHTYHALPSTQAMSADAKKAANVSTKEMLLGVATRSYTHDHH